MLEVLLASSRSEFGMTILVSTDMITPLALEHYFCNHQALTGICEWDALPKLRCWWTQSSVEAWGTTNRAGGKGNGTCPKAMFYGQPIMFTWLVIFWGWPRFRRVDGYKWGQTPKQPSDCHRSLTYPLLLLSIDPNGLVVNGTKTTWFLCSQAHLLPSCSSRETAVCVGKLF